MQIRLRTIFLIKDAKINLFTANKINSKTDKTYYREEIVE